MNLSKAISSLKMSLGLYGITLPFKDDVTGKPIPTENVIKDVLSTVTIPEYSQFQPWIRIGDCDIKQLKCIDQRHNIYLLPAFLTLTNVMYVKDVRLPQSTARGTYSDVSPVFGLNESAQGVITGNAHLLLAGQMRSEPSFEYLGENKIRLYGWPRTMLTFEVACEHDPSGESIPDGCYDSFMELAALDVKVFLYNTLKLYDGIPTAFGEINLKIEEYQTADGDRKSLLDDWRDRFHVDMGLETFW
jgi:hypothetical protein